MLLVLAMKNLEFIKKNLIYHLKKYISFINVSKGKICCSRIYFVFRSQIKTIKISLFFGRIRMRL